MENSKWEKFLKEGKKLTTEVNKLDKNKMLKYVR